MNLNLILGRSCIKKKITFDHEFVQPTLHESLITARTNSICLRLVHYSDLFLKLDQIFKFSFGTERESGHLLC